MEFVLANEPFGSARAWLRANGPAVWDAIQATFLPGVNDEIDGRRLSWLTARYPSQQVQRKYARLVVKNVLALDALDGRPSRVGLHWPKGYELVVDPLLGWDARRAHGLELADRRLVIERGLEGLLPIRLDRSGLTVDQILLLGRGS